MYAIGETRWAILETQEDTYGSIYQYELLDEFGEIMATCDNSNLPAAINLVLDLYERGPEIPTPVANEIKRLFDAQMATIFKGIGATQEGE
jgi:threonine aldolase